MSRPELQKTGRRNQAATSRPIKWLILALMIVFGTTAFSDPIPTIEITAVEQGKSVTFVTKNYPANQEFTVTMGAFGTKGVGGAVAGTFNSGAGGSVEVSMPIPVGLSNSDRIAIRAQTGHLFPYYSYNWFFNQTTGGAPVPDNLPPANQPPPSAGYSGVPTIVVTAVQRDKSVTFSTQNYPANQQFTVTMSVMGSKGVNGVIAGSFNSGAGGSMTVTMPIPAQLAGMSRIAVRAQAAHEFPYYSYNWFFNTTTQ